MIQEPVCESRASPLEDDRGTRYVPKVRASGSPRPGPAGALVATLEATLAAARFGVVLLAVSSLAGCLFLPGEAELERLRTHRGTPYSTTVFRTQPGLGDRPMSELRSTLEYWTAKAGTKAGMEVGTEARTEAGTEARTESETESETTAGTTAGDPSLAPRHEGVLVLEPRDLYSRIIGRIDAGCPSITLVAYRYDSQGLEDFTLVDYIDEKGERLGFDHVAFPKAKDSSHADSFALGYDDLQWWEYPMFILDLPIYALIGSKELAFEIVKSPLSLIDAGWFEGASERRNPFSPVCFERAAEGFWEDWRNGLSAFLWRFRVRRAHTPCDLLRDLATVTPLVGTLFERNSPPDDSAPPSPTALIVLSGGIHCPAEDEQYLGAWRQEVEAARPETVVTTAPYRLGSAFDILWSVFNLSHGFGYDLAERIVFQEGVGPGDSVEIVGFSGGGERGAIASRALRMGGIGVRKLIGVAGPNTYGSAASRTWFLLGDDPLADPVVMASHAARYMLFPFSGNATISIVPGAGGHHIPYLPHPSTREPRLGYANRFREILIDG